MRATPPALASPEASDAVDRYLTLQEAAGRYRCHVRTLRRRIAAGELPAYRNGRRILVRRDDLERALRPIPTRAP